MNTVICNKIDNRAIIPSVNNASPGAGMDYYSIASSFQHLLISRQMELQNSVIDFIRDRIGIKNALSNIAVLMIITDPKRLLELVTRYSRQILYYILQAKTVGTALWNRTSIPPMHMLLPIIITLLVYLKTR